MTQTEFAIKVYKQYFNFAAAHFLIFADGTREPLHGHNYRVMVKGNGQELSGDMVFDFLNIKPIVREVCDSLDHKLLLPGEHLKVKFKESGKNTILTTPEGEDFSFPTNDVLILPIENTSAERLAIYIAKEVALITKERFNFIFDSLEIEVEETPGQSAIFILKKEDIS